MEKKSFSLGTTDNNVLVKVIKIAFGIVCISVAVFWLIFNVKTLKSDGTNWITIAFLIGIGSFQIWSGFGKANRFIEFSTDHIRLKKNAIMPPVVLRTPEIRKIEIFPLNVIFYLKPDKKLLLRFGTTFYDINEKIIDEIINFADANSIPYEIVEEKF